MKTRHIFALLGIVLLWRAALAGPNAGPSPSGKSEAAAWSLPANVSASQPGRPWPPPPPSTQAAEWAKQLKAKAEELVFLFAYNGPPEPPYYMVTLSAPDFMIQDEPQEFVLKERITPEQAGKIVDILLAGGRLNARNAGGDAGEVPVDWVTKGWPGYHLRIAPFGRAALGLDLGHGIHLLRILNAIRAVLDGDAAKAMDKLIGKLGDLRKLEAEKAKRDAKRVVIRVSDGEDSFTINDERVEDFAELKARLAREPKDKVVEIEPGAYQTTWKKQSRELYDAAEKAGFREVKWLLDWKFTGE